MCSKERTVALGDRAYRVECTIKANPAVDTSNVIWQIGDVNVTNMTSGEVYDVFSSTAQVGCQNFIDLFSILCRLFIVHALGPLSPTFQSYFILSSFFSKF
jgi:hypothetical protein